MLHVLRKCLVIRECTNKKKLFVLVANMKCQCTAMAHRADPQAHRGGGGVRLTNRAWREIHLLQYENPMVFLRKNKHFHNISLQGLHSRDSLRKPHICS